MLQEKEMAKLALYAILIMLGAFLTIDNSDNTLKYLGCLFMILGLAFVAKEIIGALNRNE